MSTATNDQILSLMARLVRRDRYGTHVLAEVVIQPDDER